MKFKILSIGFILLGTSLVAQEKSKFSHDFEIELKAEHRYFYDEAKFDGQKNHFPSFAIQPEYSVEWNKGRESINTSLFYRLDVDKERTHGDIREFYYLNATTNLEWSVGLKKIYWGVTESNHLVDIINQTDQVESFDGEAKLGQSMVQLSYPTNNWGTFDLFYLPHFRKRNFPGEKGRLRFGILIDEDDIAFESSAEEWHQDFAIRWSHSVGVFDLGLSYFKGTGREPVFNLTEEGFNPVYAINDQVGLDIQATTGSFLWKLESISRKNSYQDMLAWVAGFEYTFGNVNGKGLDIGIIGEYSYDDRGDLALSGMQKDIFGGSRIALNDIQNTEILIGGIYDIDHESIVGSIEASRRIKENYKLEVEARLLNNIEQSDSFLYYFEKDSFLRFTLSRFF